MPAAKSYSLTPALIAAHAGERVLCLSLAGIGHSYKIHAEYPGPALNSRVLRPSLATADVSPYAAPKAVAEEAPSPLIRVDIMGAIDQRAHWVECEGYVDGHDAIADRLCAAFAEGDVLLVIDSPGGAAAGLQQAVERALEAKALYGRRCTGFSDEMIGSAATWWAMCLCDEIFGAAASQFGSIGARGGHTSIAGALEKEGVVVTWFADPPDKVALAPTHALTPVGAFRGNRDVAIAADAFRAAVCASPLGMRSGLTPEGLVALGADMLTGQAAVDAGLADGIEPFAAVVSYALAMAEGEPGESDTKTTGAAGAKGEEAMSLRAEDEKPEKKDGDGDHDGDGPKSERGIDIPTKCGACKVENDKDAKFCKGCGTSMATVAEEEESEDEKKAKAARVTAIKAPAKVSASASLASILGANGTSDLALKTAAIGLRQIRDTAVGVFGQTEPGAIVGAMLTVPDRLEKAEIAASKATAAAATAERTTRRDLAGRLNALRLDAWPRTAIFADEIKDGAPVSPPPLTKTIARWDLSEFRGYVEGFEKKAKPKTPFEASRDKAAEGAQAHAEREGTGAPVAPILGADGEPSAAQIERAKKDPAVLKMFAGIQASNPAATIDMIAKQHVKTCAAMGVALGGAS